MTAPTTARARARHALTAEIKAAARRHLAADGAAGLSLRAVARDLGMVSSAVYRYFPSRDELLTALIVDGYDALGAATEAADATCARGDLLGRWLAVGHAIRDWALAHPSEYALLYGSPVPGYRAPELTIGPASRTIGQLVQLLRDGVAAGVVQSGGPWPPPPSAAGADIARLQAELMPDVPDDVAYRGVVVWPALFGAVSFELFGQFNNAIDERAAYFDHSLRCHAVLLGLA